MFLRTLACVALLAIGIQSAGPAAGQETEAANDVNQPAEGYRIPNTEVFDLKSSGGRDYRIFIAKPAGDLPPSGYPVVYVLDANGYFPLAASLNRLRSRDPSARAIVVGIGYPIDGMFDVQRRTFDLTTKASPEKLPPSRGEQGWPESGGADQFLDFIQNELKPQIAERYSVDASQQGLIGHSFGGLFVVHTLFTQPNAFDTYVAISPSGWWNDYATLEEEKFFTKRLATLSTPVRLLIEVGELELDGKSGPASALAPTPASQEFGSTREFAKRLLQLKSDKLTVRYREFPGENHGSVVPPAMIEAFQFADRSSYRPGARVTPADSNAGMKKE